MILKFLIEKEFKQMRRNSFMPRVMVLMPLMMMLVMPFAANQEVRGVRVSVVDNDHSSYSQRLISKIDGSAYTSVAGIYSTYSEALGSIQAADADIILEIENDFERNFITGAGRVMICANSVNGTKGILGSSYMSSIVSDYGAELRAENGLLTIDGSQSPNQSLSVVPSYKFNPHLDYKVFMVPALMVMLMTMLIGFMPALNIVSEKEVGTIEQINVTPVGKLTFVAAKLIPYWALGFLILSLCMVLAWLVYGLVPAGSLITIFTFTSVYIIVVSGMGLVVSNHSSTMQQAMFVMYFFMMVLLLMSGLFTPVNSMPQWAQWVAAFNPLQYFVSVMRLVYLKGSDMASLIPQLCALIGFALFFGIWAVVSYKKTK